MKKSSPFVEICQALVKKGDKFIAENGIKSFHKEASRLLEGAALDYHYSFEELVQSYFEAKSPIVQNFPSLEFSDLPLTIARGKSCFIDVYFWRRRPTAIHNHHFVGAFQCLEGNNIDLQYKFKKREKLSKLHSMGELSLVKTSELKTGAIQSIDLQDKFIHQNHHQNDLTVNLCFRTSDIPKVNIANFLFTGLRYEKSSDVLARVHRLWRMSDIEEFDFKKLKLTSEEVLCFLMETFNSQSGNPRFQNLRSYLHQKARKELGVDMDRLMSLHEESLDKMLEVYE